MFRVVLKTGVALLGEIELPRCREQLLQCRAKLIFRRLTDLRDEKILRTELFAYR
jgi:hypothetical protein